LARYRRTYSPEYSESPPIKDAYGNFQRGYRVRIDESAPRHLPPTEAYEDNQREQSHVLELLEIVDDTYKQEALRQSVETNGIVEDESEYLTEEQTQEIIREAEEIGRMGRDDASEAHESIRRRAIREILEEQYVEMLEDFELTPENEPWLEEEEY
jgi:hypothetical protein